MRDMALVLGATMRLTRLVVKDDLGFWLLRRPVYRWAAQHETQVVPPLERDPWTDGVEDPLGWQQKLVSGLDCPFCVGFWVGTATLASYAVARQHPVSRWAWRFVAGALTLNEIAAHAGVRLGDVPD